MANCPHCTRVLKAEGFPESGGYVHICGAIIEVIVILGELKRIRLIKEGPSREDR